MKRDDVRKIFPDATDEQVDSILNGMRDELNPLKTSVRDLTAQLEGANGSLASSQASEATLRAQLDELNKQLEAHMSDEERLAAREKAAAEREREFLMLSAELDAKAIFVQAGFSEDDMGALLPLVVGTDSEATKKAAQALVDLDSARRKAAEDATKDALLKGNPKGKGGTGGGSPMKMSEYLALPYEEQLRMKAENPNILKELT